MDRRDLRNSIVNVLGEALWGFQASMILPATVLTVLLRGLGAGEGMIGSISAVEGGALIVPSVLGNYLFRSRRRRKAQILIWHFAVILPLLFVMGLVAGLETRLPPPAMRWALLGGFALFSCSIGVVGAAWMDWLAHIFDQRIRGTVMGASWGAAFLAGAAGAILAGGLIAAHPGTGIYAGLYLLAATIAALSIMIFVFIDDSAARLAEEPQPLRTGDLLEFFRRSLRERNFRAFLLGRLLATTGFCMLPFLAVYYTSPDGGGLSAGRVVAYGAAQTLGTALAGIVLGRLGDVRGHRVGILVGTGMQVVTLAVVLLTAGEASCAAAYFSAGVCIGAGFISHFNMLFETCPHDNRMAHITVGSLVLSVPAIAAPLVGGAAAARWGVKWLFAACLISSALAFFWFLFRVQDPRQERQIGRRS